MIMIIMMIIMMMITMIMMIMMTMKIRGGEVMGGKQSYLLKEPRGHPGIVWRHSKG